MHIKVLSTNTVGSTFHPKRYSFLESDEILIAYPVRKRNHQLGDNKAPVVWLSIPFRRYILHCKEQDLEQRVIGGEHRPCLGDLPQLPVESLYGIGGVDELLALG